MVWNEEYGAKMIECEVILGRTLEYMIVNCKFTYDSATGIRDREYFVIILMTD